MYTIYRITSPSGKCYIGLTSLLLRDRWDAHCVRARTGFKHPFCSAFRKYGKAAFTLEVLETVSDLATAKAAEVRWIAEYKSNNRKFGYNLSPGGDYDSETGKAAMREKMKDPDFRARYSANLTAAMKLRDPKLFVALAAAGKRWREANQRQSYANGRRAVRIATQAQNRPWTGTPDKVTKGTWERLWIDSEKVRWARHAYFTKRHVTNKWAALDVDGRRDLGARISAGQKEVFKNDPSHKAKNFEQIKAARAGVDRKKQAAAASAGQKSWWVELRKDPERYRTYMETRRATLIATLKAKSDLRHSKRGATEPVLSKRENCQ